MSYTRRFMDGYVANVKYWRGVVYSEKIQRWRRVSGEKIMK